VIRSVENPNPSAFGQAAARAPQKIMVEFFDAGMLETEDLTALRIDAGHDMFNGAILTCGVHGLKNQQHGVAVMREEKILKFTEFFDVLFEELLVVILRFKERLHGRRPVCEVDFRSFLYAEIPR